MDVAHRYRRPYRRRAALTSKDQVGSLPFGAANKIAALGSKLPFAAVRMSVRYGPIVLNNSGSERGRSNQQNIVPPTALPTNIVT